MIWVIFAALTGLAIFSILWPLAASRAKIAPENPEIAFYKAQMAEIERDSARGLIAAQDAENAKAAAGRRLLAASEAVGAEQSPSLTNIRLAALIALIVVPALGFGLYQRIGNPDLPDQPLEARATIKPENLDMLAAVAKVEAHLAKNPGDGRGYEVVAPVYLRLGRSEDAVRAWSEAIRLLGETAERKAALGEAMVYAANGVVTANARKSFEAALALDAKFPTARFYLGLAAEQDGNSAGASAIWSKLADDAPQDSAIAKSLRARIAGLSGKGAAPQGEAANAVAAMPEADRLVAIRSMVDGLAARLAEKGDDVEGWLRLVRAYRVLNEPEKARTALSDARMKLKSDTSALSRLEALARELGLEG